MGLELARSPLAPLRGARATAALGLVAILLIMGWRRRWICDDAFIDFRVVENLLAGHGPVFNAGERVEAYTNPLWVGLLLAWRSLGLELAIGAVLLGLVLTAIGLVSGIAAARTLGRGAEAYFPVGALVIACLPSMWDFATSGLETGLTFAWLGLSYWAVSHNAREKSPRSRVGTAFLVGLGPLVRPDLLFFAVAFVFLLLPAPRFWRLLVVWASPSFAYQVFRMGYFGAVISNSAIAKEPQAQNWVQGWRYLSDFLSGWPQSLALVGTLYLLAELLRHAPNALSRIAICAVPVAALLHALFVVRLGGDFMHARLLLPPLFGLLLPVFVVALPAFHRREVAVWMAIAAVVVGAIACTRIKPQEALVSEDGIADERAYYVWWAGMANPVTVSDYANTPFVAQGKELQFLAESAHRQLVVIDTGADDTTMPVPLRSAAIIPARASLPPEIRVVAGRWAIGLVSYAAGSRVHVVDRHGIADPIASRLTLDSRGRPGHEKVLGNEWIVARFAASTAATGHPEVAAVNRALRAGAVTEMLAAITEPCTAGRFLKNLFEAWRLTRLRIEPMSQNAD